MATIRDVAKLAGVSIATVSHVINETRYVSDELVSRVNKAMEELDYHPNLLASSLRGGESKTIGLIIPDISNQFFAEISRKIEDNGLEHGYSLIICNTDDNPEKEKRYIDILLSKQVDGFIFISAGDETDSLLKPISKGIPIVVADRYIENPNVNTVIVDNFDGGYQATKHLIDLGHKRIGFITGSSAVSPSSDRFEGYKKALVDSNLSVDPSIVVHGDYRYQGGVDAMQELLGADPEITAVFSCNDMMALGAIRTAYNFGLKIPEDISIIGFDDIPLAKSSYPALTTMAQPTEEMASQIIKLFVDMVDFLGPKKRSNKGGFRYQKVVLKTRLIERDSCRKL
jgi:LacI family transcriptional regulator